MNDISDKKSACFVDHEANKQFLALYCGNQRDNPKDWITYFSSSYFLQVATEPEFMALLLARGGRTSRKIPTSHRIFDLAFHCISNQKE